ncbi:MAG: SDR family oxidoreductase [Coleofasciculaceae cyanobacterium]
MIPVKDYVVLITGASSGIGAACANIFAQAGAKLILAARRQEKLEQLAEQLGKDYDCESYLLPMDVCDLSQVQSALSNLPETWSNIDILINNAGLSRGLDKVQEASIQDWEEMIDTNIKGLLYMTRTILPGMIARGRGHIINIGSIAGHQTYPGGSVYCATKAAVKSISEGLKQDLLGTPVRVSSVDPGMVETDFSAVRFHGNTERASKVYQGVTPLTPDDVADVIFFCATRSPHVNINEVIMMPTDQASATQVNRQS